MIKSFADRDSKRLYDGNSVRRWRAIERVALRKLDMLDAAHALNDLRSPPGNRLEALKGTIKGLFSIRINDQWRVVFRWEDGAEDVQILDYHKG